MTIEFIREMACAAFHRELSAARKLGYSEHDAIQSACQAQDETYALCALPILPFTSLPMRKVGRVNSDK